jgi:menaquinone-dependent protoporphyrinogen oxidase
MNQPETSRVLVAWGSKMRGTEGLARIVAETLEREGFDVVLQRASDVRDASTFDAVIVGGALYANRWHRDARRFVARNIPALRAVPVWFFSSGPLDDSAAQREILPTKEVAVLMERVGALGHTTFGGCLPADAKGFPAAAMAKTSAGDFRNPDRVRQWTADIARVLPGARPGVVIEPPARSLSRLLAHGVLGWLLCAAAMAGLLSIASIGVALTVHAVLAPLVFVAVSVHYFRARGAREPLSTALAWTAIVTILDAVVVAGALLRDFAMFTSVAGTWLPFSLILLATWVTGALMSTMPWSEAADARSNGARGGHGASASLGAR